MTMRIGFSQLSEGKAFPIFAAAALALLIGLTTPTQARDSASTAEEAEASQAPLQIVVSLPKQQMKLYRGTELVKTTRVSTGRQGYSTPAGVFSILQKRRRHFSNLYNNAPMPYMQRLTWSGIALHEGMVPNYPASHGCIRIPRGHARELFGLTERGGHVVITRDDAQPSPIEHEALFQPYAPVETAGLAADRAGEATYHHLATLEKEIGNWRSYTERAGDPVRILVTRRTGREKNMDVQRLLGEIGYDPGPVDGWIGKNTIAALKDFQKDYGLRPTGVIDAALIAELHDAAFAGKPEQGHIYVRQRFKEVFDAPISLDDPDQPLGTHMYLAMDFEDGDRDVGWTAITAQQAESMTPETALDRIGVPDDVRQRIALMLTPGSSLIISDHGLSKETGKGTDFVVLTK